MTGADQAARYRLKADAAAELAAAATAALASTSAAAERMLATMRRLNVLTGGRRAAGDRK